MYFKLLHTVAKIIMIYAKEIRFDQKCQWNTFILRSAYTCFTPFASFDNHFCCLFIKYRLLANTIQINAYYDPVHLTAALRKCEKSFSSKKRLLKFFMILFCTLKSMHWICLNDVLNYTFDYLFWIRRIMMKKVSYPFFWQILYYILFWILYIVCCVFNFYNSLLVKQLNYSYLDGSDIFKCTCILKCIIETVMAQQNSIRLKTRRLWVWFTVVNWIMGEIICQKQINYNSIKLYTKT